MTRRASFLLGVMHLGACFARVTGSWWLRPARSLRFGVVGSVAFSTRPMGEKPSP